MRIKNSILHGGVRCKYLDHCVREHFGESGVVLEIQAGDAILIPAGVAHKNLGASSDFRVVGAYPLGQRPDMNQGRSGERPRADDNIARVPLPQADPVCGRDGPVSEFWMSGVSGS